MCAKKNTKLDSIVYEPPPKRIKYIRNIETEHSQILAKKLSGFFSENCIACGFGESSYSCGLILVELTFAKENKERWISKIEYSLDSPLEIWLTYNFNLLESFVNEIVDQSIFHHGNATLIDVYAVKRIAVKEDLPFWCIDDGNFEFVEIFEEDTYFHFLRDLKTTKKIPIQTLICYLAVAFDTSVGILESLFWNNVEFGEHPIGDLTLVQRLFFTSIPNDEERLVWNL